MSPESALHQPLPTVLDWATEGQTVSFSTAADRPVEAVCWNSVALGNGSARHPLVEVVALGHGRDQSGRLVEGSHIGARLRYDSHALSAQGTRLTITQVDTMTGLEVASILSASPGCTAVRGETRVTNRGTATVWLQAVTSLSVAVGLDIETSSVLHGSSRWVAEGRWALTPLRTGPLVDHSRELHDRGHPGSFRRNGLSTWSTGDYECTGGLVDEGSGIALLWQIEHNGPWTYEVGELADGLGVSLLGPTDLESHWLHELRVGESFDTVPVALALGREGLASAVAAMTAHRRAQRGAVAATPIVFNDYMNTLAGDPTTDRLLPLVEAAAEVGAEVFCIDAGWYAEGEDWWDGVGEWVPSPTRFPQGLDEVIDRVLELGMVPGLWLEPEVIGVRSPMASTLPSEAFLTRRGVRIEQHGRFFLDLANPSARAHLDQVVDRLVDTLGVGYFKLDYNVTPGAGSDKDGLSPGAGLLKHCRATIEWLEAVRARHPQLILENCGSGAMRSDYAMLQVLQLQSTSDQQDPLRYPPIAAGAPMAVLPEQAANWAYPQPGMTTEESCFTLATSLLGTFYLSGYLNRMTSQERHRVAEAVTVAKAIRSEVATAAPIWPAGLPAWEGSTACLGLVTAESTLATVWQRTEQPMDVVLEFPHLTGLPIETVPIFPTYDIDPWQASWNADTGLLHLTSSQKGPSARVFRLRPISS